MNQLASLLMLLAAPAVLAKDAWCCGYRKEYDETKLWEARWQLCNNVWSNQWVDGHYMVVVQASEKLDPYQHAILATDNNNDFRYCWEATETIINQCVKDKKAAAGVWEMDGETYELAAGSFFFDKPDDVQGSRRDFNETLANLPALPQMVGGNDDFNTQPAKNGTYLIGGLAVELSFSGFSDFAQLGKRGEEEANLMTSYGSIGNFTIATQQQVNLTNLIEKSLSWHKKRTLAKRGDTRCYTYDHYAMTAAGTWWENWVQEGGCYAGGHNYGGAPRTANHRITSYPYLKDLGGLADDLVFETFAQAHLDWRWSWNRGTGKVCKWNQGQCHTYWSQQGWVWQRGFYIDWETDSEGVIVPAPYWRGTVYLVHADAPSPANSWYSCNSGCCGGATAGCGSPPFCSLTSSANADWFNTCADPYSNACHGSFY